MNIKSLQDKLELYYDRLKNPPKIIKNWAIIDLELLNTLKKIKINNINDITNYLDEKIISAETKDKYIVIKVSFNFIAIKIIDTEYDYIIKDWDLIAVDKNYVYKGKETKPMTNKEIMQFLGFKLNKKLIKNLEYFG